MSARAADISGLQTVIGSHQPDDRAMLAMGEQRADDRRSVDPHQLLWK
jgi:hypothetical protein